MSKNHQSPYLMPSEWQPQSATWLSWPHNIETWQENLGEAQSEFVELVKCIAPSQEVRVLVGDDALPSARSQIGTIPNLGLVSIPTNDAWARDYAPTFVHANDGRLVALDWHYNAWGGKYPPFDEDQQVANRVAKRLGIECVAPGLCIEGGAIEVNDSGVLLTTVSCALNSNRNPHKSKDEVETILCHYLGMKHCIWLSGNAIEGDDTDGHIDQLARFTDNETIVYAWSDDASDPQLPGLERNLIDLRRGLSAAGMDHYQLIPLSLPRPVECCGQRIPASYCNFLMTNHLVVVPQFGEPEDERALRTLRPLFPNRTVIGLPSNNLSVGLGSFHCLSQQQPAVSKT
jgi:agmatine deiminase